jgi:hypothetical protein
VEHRSGYHLAIPVIVENRLIVVELEHTLMSLSAKGSFEPSKPFKATLFIAAPPTWFYTPGEREKVKSGLDQMLLNESARLRAKDPDDPGYLRALDFSYAELELADKPPFVWEQTKKSPVLRTSCFAFRSTEWVIPMRPRAFTQLVLLHLLVHNALTDEDFIELAIGHLGLPRGVAERAVADPGHYVSLTLRMAEEMAGE